MRRKRTITSPFAKILRTLMSERNMTLREASHISGVSPSTIDDWRAGAIPADHMAVKRLAKALGVTLSFILTGEVDNSKGINDIPTIVEVFEDGGHIFDGYAKITIQQLIVRKKGEPK